MIASLTDPTNFTRLSGITLRGYQRAVAQAVVDSVLHRRGQSFAVMFPRQSGKNELQAQIEALLLVAFSLRGGEIVKISPTWRPQSLNAMRRLERVLEQNPATRGHWEKESGFIYRLNRARIIFLSGAPEANIVGATASLLLEVDEAQDVGLAKYDKEIAPMAASTDATRVFWGTAWTSQTLLARELRAIQSGQAAGRVFRVTAEDVSAEVPAYGRFVSGQVARLGRGHPLVRTQFFAEEIDGQAGLFTAERLALMQGCHLPRSAPEPGKLYALLVDVGGEKTAANGLAAADSETISSTEQKPAADQRDRDATALTVVEVDLGTLSDPALRAPTYRVMQRRAWVGVAHTQLYAEIRALAEHWRARQVVVDASGVGAGLASFLARALPGKVIPFTFSLASKSRLGWDFLALLEAGRWQEHAPIQPPDPQSLLQQTFWQQARLCQYEILPGPGKLMRWSVPDGARDPISNKPVHDDLLVSAALCAVLDGQAWPQPGAGQLGVVRGKDPLDEMRGF